MKLSIIIPVYNEEKTIKKILEKVIAIDLPKIKKEIIIVDDDSNDGTGEVLKKLKSRKIRIYKHQKNKGKGAAIRTGFSKMTGNICIIQDADLEYNPKDYKRLINYLLNNRCDVVYGSRLINYPLVLWGGKKTIMPLHWFGNKFLTALTNFLYDSSLTDMETCYKLFKKEVMKDLLLTANRFDIEPEITAKILKKGFKIHEIPIKVKPRTHEEGKKISWRDGFIAVWTLLKYRFRD